MKKIGVIFVILVVMPLAAAHIFPFFTEDTQRALVNTFGAVLVGFPVVAFFWAVFTFRRWKKETLDPRILGRARAFADAQTNKRKAS